MLLMLETFGVRLLFVAQRELCDTAQMADWIKNKAQTYQRSQNAAQTAEEVRLHKAKLIEARARELLDKITEAVRRDVAEYQEEFKNHPERRVTFNAKPSGGFKLDKSHYPAAYVETSLEGNRIRADYMSRHSSESPTQRHTKYLGFEVDINDDICVRADDRNFSNFEDISRYLIEPVFDA